MKKGLTELVFILDRSGSMDGLERNTIDGFNSMIEKQKKVEGEAIVTTVLFDDKYELLHDRFPLKMIQPMTENEYFVRGCTGLLDAIGKTIHKIGNVQKYMADEERAEKVIFVITTDGLENSSKEYSYDKIEHMIERQKKHYNWEFIFLGANIDAVAEAKRFGIGEDRAVTYNCDKEGVEMNYRVISDTVCSMRMDEQIGGEWKEEIDDDYRRRGRR